MTMVQLLTTTDIEVGSLDAITGVIGVTSFPSVAGGEGIVGFFIGNRATGQLCTIPIMGGGYYLVGCILTTVLPPAGELKFESLLTYAVVDPGSWDVKAFVGPLPTGPIRVGTVDSRIVSLHSDDVASYLLAYDVRWFDNMLTVTTISASLTLEVWIDNSFFSVDQTLILCAQITNVGGSDALDVRATVSLTDCVLVGNSVTHELGTISPGQSKTTSWRIGNIGPNSRVEIAATGIDSATGRHISAMPV
jgi:hypothetical protein